MSKLNRIYEYLIINIHYLGLTTLSQTMTPLVIPLLVQQFVGDDQKATYYGNLRLWSLMVALLIQAFSGMVSDRSRSRWGRRRPFILLGSALNIIIIVLIGATARLEGMEGYWLLFSLALLMMAAANISHSAQQSLIPDLIPEERRGVASGIKAIMEVPLPLLVVALLIGPAIARDQLWLALGTMLIILVSSALITMLIKEEPPRKHLDFPDVRTLTRVVLMVAIFTGTILILGSIIRMIAQIATHQISVDHAHWLFGGVGLVFMSIAVRYGVFISTRVSLGNDKLKSNHAFTWWVINRLFFLVASTNLASFAVFFLQGRLGYTQEEAAEPASWMLLLVGVFILLTAIPGGWLANRYGHKIVIAVTGIVAASGTAIVMASATTQGIYTGAILVGISTGIFYTANWALGTQLVPKQEVGRYLGISNLAGAGAGAIGAYLGGPIADFYTHNFPAYPGLGYVILFGIYGVLFLFSTGAIFKVNLSSTRL